ncbi:Gfo/Idh/MocA family protein [Microbacterium hydrocarbonoxydans]|uniref:Gfo/Idh/MocA family protein n=1 Tax=Microbacterium hydrocarbonoxydans TaxID=273678 RepID=UPI0007BC33FC|nr:Gfo/Idh/MocA family oxidoreductase [Microbacterium hydrocarbonoxydans]GAT74256.1 dehydrogenase [Microbacterium sp. HM58-2]
MTTRPLRVAVIGAGFMARAHSHAWRTAPRFFDLPREPRLSVLVSRDESKGAQLARDWGWESWSGDWRTVIDRDDIDVVDICTPGDTHARIAVAALEAGRHVLCEKPLANDPADAAMMVAASESAARRGVVAMCGYSYRRTPALASARRLIADGALGTIRHVRAQYLQDWLSDPDAPHTWRLDRAAAGSGALGDIGAHSIDTAQWLTGELIEGVSARLRTFVTTRPQRSAEVGLGGTGDPDSPRLPVDVDDAAAFIAGFSGGALGVFEATRMALGRRNANRIEINGDRGSVAFDFERMNELEYYSADDGDDRQGFRTIQATDPAHPYADAWWPAGHGLGYEHAFTHQIVDFVRSIESAPASPGFADAHQVQRVLAAVEESAADEGRYTRVR